MIPLNFNKIKTTFTYYNGLFPTYIPVEFIEK